MKTTKQFFITAGLFLLMACPAAFASSESENVNITKADSQKTHAPRVPAYVPISCVVDGELGYVAFSFSSVFGMVSISLTNFYSGETVTIDVDTADGGVIIPFSGDEGSYHISILTETNVEYVGEFQL